MHGAEQPRDSIKMIAVQVSDKDAVNSAALHTGTHQLQLRAFATIEQKHISIANHGGRREPTSERRDSGTCSKQYDSHED
jgi:hypothetical protein